MKGKSISDGANLDTQACSCIVSSHIGLKQKYCRMWIQFLCWLRFFFEISRCFSSPTYNKWSSKGARAHSTPWMWCPAHDIYTQNGWSRSPSCTDCAQNSAAQSPNATNGKSVLWDEDSVQEMYQGDKLNWCNSPKGGFRCVGLSLESPLPDYSLSSI